MKDTKLNNLIGLEEFSEKDFFKKTSPTKRTDVAKDVLKENAYVVGKDVNEKPKSKEEHNFKQLHNLIKLDDFTQKTPDTSAKPTKRTDVAKDVIKESYENIPQNIIDEVESISKQFRIYSPKSAEERRNAIEDLMNKYPKYADDIEEYSNIFSSPLIQLEKKSSIKENAYVVGKEVNEKPKTKEEAKLKDMNNLLKFDDFSQKTSDTSAKSTKRTDVAKDVILEKKKKCDDDCEEKESKKKKEDCDDEDKPKGLTAGQKKLPKALQDAILKRQNKK